MKAINSIICTFAAALALASCGAPTPSKSVIKSKVTEELASRGLTVINETLKTGYYEENNADARYQLRKLAAAGVVTYHVKRVYKSEAYKSGTRFDWQSYDMVPTYSYRNVKKYFVNVALTDAGRKCLGKELEFPVKADKYANAPHGSFPEDNVSMEEHFPDDEKDSDKGNVDSDASSKSSSSSSSKKSSKAKETEKVPSEYEKEKQNEHSNIIDVFACEVKVVDVNEIIALHGTEEGCWRANFITKVINSTPFGRILCGKYEGDYNFGEVVLEYYADKKWSVKDINY